MASNEALWHPSALREARQARDWYAERSRGAARGFLLVLNDAMDAVIQAPERWPETSGGYRIYVLPGRYPFSLIYRYDGLIKIIAVAHQSRRPRYWDDRQ